MALKLQPAVNILKSMKVLTYGPSHSGKTLSSLYLALGMVMKLRGCTEDEAYKHIVMIDTEYGRGALYSSFGPYNYLNIEAPYYTEKLVKLIQELNTMDEVDVIIVDSLSHFWVKEGGILDQKANKDKQGGNSYSNWLEYTAKFNAMLDILMSSPKIILTTARSKNDTALVENEKGKMVPKTYGLKPELRDGIDFEFDIVFNVDKDTHNLFVEKGIPGMLPIYEAATPDLGVTLHDRFVAGRIVPVRTEQDVMDTIRKLAQAHHLITHVQLVLSGRKLEEMSMEDLLAVEADVIKTAKKGQSK